MDRPRVDQVVVVQDQRQLLRSGLELVDQGGHHDPARHDAGATQQRQHVLAEAAGHAIKRRDHIPPEPHRVVVLRVQRQPRDRPPRVGGPAGQQGGLAEPRGRAHQDHLRAIPWLSRWIRRERPSRSGRVRGMLSLVARSSSRARVAAWSGDDVRDSAIASPAACSTEAQVGPPSLALAGTHRAGRALLLRCDSVRPLRRFHRCSTFA